MVHRALTGVRLNVSLAEEPDITAAFSKVKIGKWLAE
jgi:hypothetical protein